MRWKFNRKLKHEKSFSIIQILPLCFAKFYLIVIMENSHPMIRFRMSSGRVLICIVDPLPLLMVAIGMDISVGVTRDSNLAT